MITDDEAELLLRVLATCDPASDCSVGNWEIWRAQDIVCRETKVGPILLLSDEEREVLRNEVLADCLDHMFGDGMEREYILNGFPSYKGLNLMTDHELLIERGHYVEGDSPEEMVRKVRAEWRGEEW